MEVHLLVCLRNLHHTRFKFMGVLDHILAKLCVGLPKRHRAVRALLAFDVDCREFQVVRINFHAFFRVFANLKPPAIQTKSIIGNIHGLEQISVQG